MEEDEFFYGYAKISGFYDGDANLTSFTVYETAYNSTVNQGIAVGAIPEPGSFALLSLTFGAIAGSRRRRQSA